MDNQYLNNYDMFKHLLHNITTFKETQTFKLLTISILVSISGIFRVYISSVLLHTDLNLLMGLGTGLIIYSVYTIDRIGDDKFFGSNDKLALFVSLSAALCGIYIFLLNNHLLLALFPFVIGFVYSKGIKLSGHTFKLKGGYGVKNIVIGITWAVLIVGSAGFGTLIPFLIVFLLYAVKLFCNSNENDFKDIESDTLAGLKTLPVILGAQKLRILLLSLHVLAHLIILTAMVYGIIIFSPIILICSFLCAGFCIINCEHAETPISKFFRDGESAITVGLMVIAGLV